MARKSKEFSSLLRQKHDDDLHQQGLDTLRNRADDNLDVRTHTEGELKMSEVIEEFIAPHLEPGDSADVQKSLISMGIVAWNLALLPSKKRRKEKNAFLNAMCADQKELLSNEDMAEFRAGMADLIDSLIKRKLSRFKHIERKVIDFEMQDSLGEVHLSVMSTI